MLAETASEKTNIVKELQNMFEVRVADKVNLFLGVHLGWELDSEGRPVSLKLSQPLYIEGMLRRFGLENSKPARTPMVQSFFPSFATEPDKSVTKVFIFFESTHFIYIVRNVHSRETERHYLNIVM